MYTNINDIMTLSYNLLTFWRFLHSKYGRFVSANWIFIPVLSSICFQWWTNPEMFSARPRVWSFRKKTWKARKKASSRSSLQKMWRWLSTLIGMFWLSCVGHVKIKMVMVNVQWSWWLRPLLKNSWSPADLLRIWTDLETLPLGRRKNLTECEDVWST